MRVSTAMIAALTLGTAIVSVIGIMLVSSSEAQSAQVAGATEAGETAETQIERAMSAGPPEIARSARIIDKDAEGHLVVLREGTNGFTCMPGNPKDHRDLSISMIHELSMRH
jgi:hypothetical protein